MINHHGLRSHNKHLGKLLYHRIMTQIETDSCKFLKKLEVLVFLKVEITSGIENYQLAM